MAATRLSRNSSYPLVEFMRRARIQALRNFLLKLGSTRPNNAVALRRDRGEDGANGRDRDMATQTEPNTRLGTRALQTATGSKNQFETLRIDRNTR